MMIGRTTVVEQIRELDAQLLVAGDRLRRYKKAGQTLSASVQQGVIDRMLLRRMELMKERDR